MKKHVRVVIRQESRTCGSFGLLRRPSWEGVRNINAVRERLVCCTSALAPDTSGGNVRGEKTGQ